MIPIHPACRLILLAGLWLAAAGSAVAQTPTATSPALSSDDAIRTPPAPKTPRINGARVYGARPGRPFSFHIPVTGERPLTVSASALPPGLAIDSSTGNISGTTGQAGDFSVVLTASNALGQDTKTLRILIGSNICLTPPLGWNSWNCFHGNIDEAKIREAADAMVSTGLIDHGWTYINMDDRWEGKRDAQGNIQSSAAMHDLGALSAYIHGLGLKFGLYSSPGPRTCAGAVGSYQHEDQDAASYAAWGMDYLKYDWCSYNTIAGQIKEREYAKLLPPEAVKEITTLSAEMAVLNTRKWKHDPTELTQMDDIKAAIASTQTMTREQVLARMKEIDARLAVLHSQAKKEHPEQVAAMELQIDKTPYQVMRASLDKVDRDIVFSFCQYGMGNVWEWGAEVGGNTWRTTGDISPSWSSVESHGFGQNGHEKYAGPGHWNDPDMLEIGNGNLTPDENYTHMTLWCMLASPLLIGCDMPRMTPFTVSLFSNDEVLAVNQDPAGKQGWRAKQDGQREVWMKPMADGSLAVAFFNRGPAAADVSVQWSDLMLQGPQTVRDLWRQKDQGQQASGYTVNVASHGAELFLVKPAKP